MTSKWQLIIKILMIRFREIVMRSRVSKDQIALGWLFLLAPCCALAVVPIKTALTAAALALKIIASI
jgi:hypothetical protein